MDHHDKYFSPETVKEQIEQCLGTSQPREQVHTSPAEVVQMLQGIYQEEPRLRRVWERLADHLPTAYTSEKPGEEQTPHATIVRFPQEKVNRMQTQTRILEQTRKRGSFQRRLGLLVAVLAPFRARA